MKKFLTALDILAAIFWLTIILAAACQAQTPGPYDLPNPILTPSATNADVTQDNIDKTICVDGYTKTIRPPPSYTNALKVQQLHAYRFPNGKGYASVNPKDYEEDHLISLEIGGNPTAGENLWPEIYGSPWGAHVKDKLENKLKEEVCAGTMKLDEAQSCISKDWIACYKLHVKR